MTNLQTVHPTLFQRVRDLVFVKLALGLALIFSPPIPAPQVNRTNLALLLNLKIWGSVFLILGLVMLVSLYYTPSGKYRVLRWVLLISFGYNLMWLLSLLLQVLTGGLQSAPILFLWAYYTRNVFHMYNDPGWETVALLRGRNGT